MTKRISIGLVRLHCLRLTERARGGEKLYYGSSLRSDRYVLHSGEECLRVGRVLWASAPEEMMEDALQDIESMLACGYARSARQAVEMLAGRSFADWCDDQADFDRVDWDCIPASAVDPLTDSLFASGVSGEICDAIYDSLTCGVVPSRGDLVRETGCTDWRARKAIERLEELALDYAEAYRMDRLAREICAELAD